MHFPYRNRKSLNPFGEARERPGFFKGATLNSLEALRFLGLHFSLPPVRKWGPLREVCSGDDPSTETSNGGPTTRRACTEIKTHPQTHAALPPDNAASHTRCCHHTHARCHHTQRAVTKGPGMRPNICIKQEFQSILQEYLSLAPHLHLLNVATVPGGGAPGPQPPGWRHEGSGDLCWRTVVPC